MQCRGRAERGKADDGIKLTHQHWRKPLAEADWRDWRGCVRLHGGFSCGHEAFMALTAYYWTAGRPERLASPWPAERTAKMLLEHHEEELLKAFKIRPFGDLREEGTKP